MKVHYLLPLVGGLLILSCAPLQEEEMVTDLIPFDNLPAEWGHLVAVNEYPGSEERVGWYEFWFSNPETGRVTYVPMYRPEWGYLPDKVRVIERSG
jgi:hypothetical protein